MRGPRLQDQGVLIVGGTGGLGQSCARRFLEEGARVVVAGLSPGLDEVRIKSWGTSENLHQILCDVSRPADVESMIEESVKLLGGRLDVLLHIAGISGRRFGDGPLHECTDDGWERVLTVNARGVFITNRRAVQVMRTQPLDHHGLRGTIVNIGSILAESPSHELFGTVAYTASKGAIRSLTLASAAQYASEKIRFQLIEPGLIATPMAARAVNDLSILEFLATKQAMTGGPGWPDDIAEAALYLSEPATHFSTGVILPVDGGWRLLDGQISKSPHE